MPICIAGMHRSGTSMVTRLLQTCGVQLGPPEAMIPPAPDNPEGFWEHRGFVTINDELLVALRGNWANPPPELADDWLAAPAVVAHRTPAQALLDGLGFAEPWGWKDPRNALTVGFWRNLLPGLRVVVCVRHPAAVVASMRARGAHSPAHCAALYRSYHETLLAAVPATDRVVTHYEAYFADPAREVTRLCGALGLTPTPAAVDDAVATIRAGLNHHALPADVDVPPDVLAFYDAHLRAEPSDVAPPAATPQRESLLRTRVLALDDTLRDATAHGVALSATLADRTAERDRTVAALADAHERITARDEAIAALQARLATEQAEGSRLDAALDALGAEADALRADGARLRAELAAITGSRAWRLLEWTWALRLRLAPRGSRRERLLKLGPAPAGR